MELYFLSSQDECQIVSALHAGKEHKSFCMQSGPVPQVQVLWRLSHRLHSVRTPHSYFGSFALSVAASVNKNGCETIVALSNLKLGSLSFPANCAHRPDAGS